MAHDVISTCPVCAGELAVTRLRCSSCGTTLEGEFSVGRFGRLSREQMALLESFLRSRGNLRDIERELGISYPTVRARVEALVRALGFGPRSTRKRDATDDDDPHQPAGQPRGDPRAAGPPRDQRRGRRPGDPGAREEPLMTDDPRTPPCSSTIRSAGTAASRSACPPPRSGSSPRTAIGRPSGRRDGRGLPDRRDPRDDRRRAHDPRAGHASGSPSGSGRKTVALEIGVPPEADVTDRHRERLGRRRGPARRPALPDRVRRPPRVEDASGRIDLNAVSGDAFLQLAGSVELGAKTVSGDIRVEGGSLVAVRAQTTSGDIRLDSPLGRQRLPRDRDAERRRDRSLRPRGLRVEARTVSGDLTSELPHRSEGRAGPPE